MSAGRAVRAPAGSHLVRFELLLEIRVLGTGLAGSRVVDMPSGLRDPGFGISDRAENRADFGRIMIMILL